MSIADQGSPVRDMQNMDETELDKANGKTSRKQWWNNLPIPHSWYLSEGPPYRERDRDREPLDLDDTRSSYRRRFDDPPALPPSQPRVLVPIAVLITIVLWSIGQLTMSVWWAATLQSNLNHEVADRAKEEARLWDGIQTYRAETNALRLEVARLTGNNRKPREEE